jgi:DNA-binding CsgD family transcriptional regulator
MTKEGETMATAVHTRETTRPEGVDDRQRAALWFASQGYALDSIATELSLTPAELKDLLNKAMAGLGARNLVHAVALAIHGGHLGKYCDCGTNSAYLRHVSRDEAADPLCRAAHLRQVTGRSAYANTARLTATQITVLRALYAGAATLQEAADSIGMSRDRIGSHVSSVYRKLGVADYPWAQRRAMALKRAEQMGLFND